MADSSRKSQGQPSSTTSLRLISSRRKKVVLFSVAMNSVLFNVCNSALGPVFPLEVRKVHPHHDAKAGFAIGMVFSVATLTNFIFAPFVGRDVHRTGAKRMLGLGAFLVSGVTILFSFVSSIAPWSTFLGFCYALRFCQGIGMAAVFVSTFSILVATFPDSVASVSGLLQVFTGLGYMLGPAIGGLLYEHAGFKATFLFVGCMLLAGTVVIQIVLPEPECVEESTKQSFPMLTILRRPRAFIMLVAAFWSKAALGFLDPTLGPFLHEGHNLGPSAVGLCFLIAPGVYMCLSPVVGYIADNYARRPLIPAGCFVTALGYELMGPDALFGIHGKLGVVLAGLAVVGIGFAVTAVPISADILDTMRKKGFPDTPELLGAIGGLLGAAESLGVTVGPAIGGTLTASFNFGDGTAVFGLVFIVLGGVITLGTMSDAIVKRCSKRDAAAREEGQELEERPLTKAMEPKSTN